MERLLESVSRLDYPQDKLQIQVLDDSTDETTEICKVEVAKLIERGFDAEHVHRVDRTGYKAGALENGTETAKGETDLAKATRDGVREPLNRRSEVVITVK